MLEQAPYNTNLYKWGSKSAVLQDSQTFPAKGLPMDWRRQEIHAANFLLSYGESAGDCSRQEFVTTI